jgi:cytochrome c-type biogenesis protein
MSGILGVAAAFAAGLLSFLSPCVLPLVPSYVSFLAGGAVSEQRTVIARTAAFVVGFSAVFTALGIILSSSAAMIGGASRFWGSAAGIVVVILGFNVLFDFVKLLNFEARFRPVSRPAGLFGSFLFGAAFGAGWSPCVGPMLASILFMAGSGSVGRAALLLAAYSFGLALPFLAAGLFLGRTKTIVRALAQHLRLVKMVSGVFLIAVGVSMLTGNFQESSSAVVRLGYALQDASDSLLVRVGFSAFYALIGLALLASIMRSRGPRAFLRPSGVISAALLILAALEAFGVVRSAPIIASWLVFQGI